MDMKLKCPKCSEPMMRSLNTGVFYGRRQDGMEGKTETVRYMCTGCGYVEERAINPFHLRKTQ